MPRSSQILKQSILCGFKSTPFGSHVQPGLIKAFLPDVRTPTVHGHPGYLKPTSGSQAAIKLGSLHPNMNSMMFFSLSSPFCSHLSCPSSLPKPFQEASHLVQSPFSSAMLLLLQAGIITILPNRKLYN